MVCTLWKFRFNDSHNLQSWMIHLKHPFMSCSRTKCPLETRFLTCQNSFAPSFKSRCAVKHLHLKVLFYWWVMTSPTPQLALHLLIFCRVRSWWLKTTVGGSRLPRQVRLRTWWLWYNCEWQVCVPWECTALKVHASSPICLDEQISLRTVLGWAQAGDRIQALASALLLDVVRTHTGSSSVELLSVSTLRGLPTRCCHCVVSSWLQWMVQLKTGYEPKPGNSATDKVAGSLLRHQVPEVKLTSSGGCWWVMTSPTPQLALHLLIFCRVRSW